MSRRDIIGFMKKNNVKTPISEAENVPSSNIGCCILRNGFVCNTFQEVYTRSMLNGALWASTPMHEREDGFYEYPDAWVPGSWTSDLSTFTDRCAPIKWSDVSRVFPSVKSEARTKSDDFLLKFLAIQGRFDGKAACDEQDSPINHKDSRSIAALDLCVDENHQIPSRALQGRVWSQRSAQGVHESRVLSELRRRVARAQVVHRHAP